MSFEQTYLIPRLHKGDRVYLVFHPARARLSSWQPPLEGHGIERVPGDCQPRNVVALRILAKEHSGEVQILASEPPLELVKYVVLHEGCPFELAPPEDGEFFHLVPSDRPLAQLLLGTDDYLTELWDALGAAPDTPLWRYRRFFADLDRHTDETLRKEFLAPTQPGLLAVMDSSIPVVMSVLADCIARRARDETHGYRSPPYSGAAIMLAELQAVSDVFLSLLFKHFRIAGRGIDLDSVEDAFEMFANGELRLQLPSLAWACQPSSGMYFYFAEFALMCAGAGIESGLWTRLANGMVRTQRIYCTVYQPSDAPPWNLFHYKANNHDSARTFTRVEKDLLARAFGGKSLEELAIAQAANIEEFAPDEVDEAMVSQPPVGLPQPAPVPPPPARLPSLVGP